MQGQREGTTRVETSRQLTYSVIINIMTSTVSENIQMKKKIEKFSEKMARKTKFSESEVEKLVHVYNKITVSNVQSSFPKVSQNIYKRQKPIKS